jgi:hypothetical protein
VALPTFSTIFAADRLDLGIGQGLVARLQARGDGDGFLAHLRLGLVAGELVEHRTRSISALSAPAAALTSVSASTPLSTTKAKSRSTACRSGQHQRRARRACGISAAAHWRCGW